MSSTRDGNSRVPGVLVDDGDADIVVSVKANRTHNQHERIKSRVYV